VVLPLPPLPPPTIVIPADDNFLVITGASAAIITLTIIRATNISTREKATLFIELLKACHGFSTFLQLRHVFCFE
jgi:hypothetical protein